MIEPKFEAAVGMSRKWDAREAGREVARNTIEKLSRPPDFFLLFSTIHYEKHGGFQEFLNSVWDVLPKGTPLVGGTVAGFTNNYGCYTRGTSALAVSYSNMDVATGFGKNTKRNPKKAARKCAEMIKEKLNASEYKNKFILDIISSGLVPEIPGLGRTMIIHSKLLSTFTPNLLNLSGKLFQKGVCRQDEVLKELIKSLPDYFLISGGSTDDIKQLRNYQFFNNTVLTNSICALALNMDLPITVNSTHGLVTTDKKFIITGLDRTKRVIKSIDGKPAVPRIFDLLHLNKEKDLNEHIFRKIFFLPIGFKSINNELIPSVAGIFLGDYFVVIFQVENNDATMLNLSGHGLIDSIDQNLIMCSNNTEFALFSSCGMRLLALGNHAYAIHKKLKDRFNDTPFLLYDVAGEAAYSPKNGLQYGNYLFNSVFIG